MAACERRERPRRRGRDARVLVAFEAGPATALHHPHETAIADIATAAIAKRSPETNKAIREDG
jgi:hypothetical protein